MNSNIGSADRALRLILAVALVAAVLSKAVDGPLAIVAVALAVILAVTAVVRFCPLYAPFKFSTKADQANQG